jgi:16S rRNA (cytosine1402-N4)-methyltransferase
MPEPQHIPALLNETIDHLNLRAGQTVVDCTLGLGGHSEAILEKIGPKGHLIAFDQDEGNLKAAKERLKKYEKQITYIHDNFEYLEEHLKEKGIKTVNAIFFDLGLSSPHVDDPERGFSFMKDGPLDMRYDKRQGLTAEKVVNTYNEEKLAYIIFKYGEERRSRVIAKKIVHVRKTKPITSTLQLVRVIGSTMGGHKSKIHPATLTFQALRIYVNREMEVLEKALDQAVKILETGGRIAVISYHSLEDRTVKNKLRYYTQDCICPKELPVCQCNFKKKLYLLTRKPIIPNGIEVSRNPRSRSAKMRVAERL